MTLEEAIKKVVNYRNFLEFALAKYIRIADEKDVEAIDTVLNYIENESIPKEKIRKKIEECVKRRQELANGHFWESQSNINEDTAIVMAQILYQELLGE